MKKSIIQRFFRFTTVMFFSFVALAAFAQEKTLDVDIDVKKESAWYEQPWSWVVGAAIFILLLVAILRGGRAQKNR